MEPEHFSFLEFRKKHLTPWFRQIRRYTDVMNTTKYIRCCHMHLLDEYESIHDYEPPRLPAMGYTRHDMEYYKEHGEMSILLYGCTTYRLDWIKSLAETHQLSFVLDNVVCDGCEVYTVTKKYEIRRRMKKIFFAAIMIRIALGRLLQRMYRPPDGRMFLKLRDEWCSPAAP